MSDPSEILYNNRSWGKDYNGGWRKDYHRRWYIKGNEMKILEGFMAFFFILILVSSVNAQQQININNRYREYRISVDLKPRILIIENDGEMVYMRYFSNSAFETKMQYLGEEVYRNGKKIIDTFKEND